MIELSVSDLREAFPLEPIPSAADLTDSFGDDVSDDLSMIKGKRWDEISPHEFRFHFEVVCWLTPVAFRYYLPSIIACSANELQSCGRLRETELVVDYTLRMLAKSDSEEIERRRINVWNALSADQMRLVRRWISALAKHPECLPESSEILSTAIDERENGKMRVRRHES